MPGYVGYRELIKLREEPVPSTTAFFIDGVELER
jgi:hypothetical protein